MITSNRLSEEEKRQYILFLGQYYEHYWSIWTQGSTVTPVISESDVENIFQIEIDDAKYRHMTPSPQSGFSVCCPVSGAVYNIEQFKAIGIAYGLTDKEEFKYLLAAHDLKRYNAGLLQDIEV